MKTGSDFYSTKFKNYLEECHFDIGTTPSNSFFLAIDEAKLAKMITRIVISSATLVTTSLSLRQYAKDLIKTYRKSRI